MFQTLRFKFSALGLILLAFVFARTSASATNRVFSLVSDQSVRVPDAALGFANLFNTSGFGLIDAQCQVFVNRPEHKSGVYAVDPENRIECSVSAAVRILMPLQKIYFDDSPVESWGSRDEASFLVRGQFAQMLWEKLHRASWSEFNGRIDASIYFPMISCHFDPEISAIGACNETYVIDRKIESQNRSQVMCTRKTELAAGALDAPSIEGFDPADPSLMQRKYLSTAILKQLKAAERSVLSYSCIFMD